jgi:hypothetical protein
MEAKMNKDSTGDNKAEAVELLKKNLMDEKARSLPVNLDDLIEMLDADDLRNVIGMMRPKGKE